MQFQIFKIIKCKNEHLHEMSKCNLVYLHQQTAKQDNNRRPQNAISDIQNNKLQEWTSTWNVKMQSRTLATANCQNEHLLETTQSNFRYSK